LLTPGSDYRRPRARRCPRGAHRRQQRATESVNHHAAGNLRA
jgi:hypothetical protein